MTNYAIALVGYGAVTQAHIAAFQKIQNVKISAIVSQHLTQEGYDQAKIGNEIKIFKTLDELLAADAAREIKIDIVDICNRPDLHAENAIKAAKAGKHLIIEKPIALMIEDCYAIEKTIYSAGVKACVCFECRYSDQFQKTKMAIDRYLGQVRSCAVDYYHGIGPTYPQFPWNIKTKYAGDSFLSAGCHALDGALFFMEAEVASVYSVSTHQPHAHFSVYEYNPIQTIIIKFKDGRFANVTSNISYHGQYYFPVHLCGTEGSLTMNQVQLATGEKINLEMKLLTSGDPNNHPYLEQFKAFIQALNEGKNMLHTDFSTALKTHEVMHLARRSIELGCVVGLEALEK